MNRVVITGMGIYSCIGKNLQEVKQSLYNGKSGIIFDENIDASGSSINRITFGTEFYPISFMEVRCQARFTGVTGKTAELNPEYILMVHTWF